MTHIRATTQFWGPPQDTRKGHVFPGGIDQTLSDLDRYCFECPLPDCNQMDRRCPHNDDRSPTKRAYDLAHKAALREVDEAVERILAEREAT